MTDNDKDGFYGQYNDLVFDQVQTSSVRLLITKPSWQGTPVNPNDQIARLMEIEVGFEDVSAPGKFRTSLSCKETGSCCSDGRTLAMRIWLKFKSQERGIR